MKIKQRVSRRRVALDPLPEVDVKNVVKGEYVRFPLTKAWIKVEKLVRRSGIVFIIGKNLMTGADEMVPAEECHVSFSKIHPRNFAVEL